MIVTGLDAKNIAALHGHCQQCLHRIQTERNPWRIEQLVNYEVSHRKRKKVIHRLLQRLTR